MIVATTIAIAAAGAATLGGLAFRLKGIDDDLRLRRHRSKDAGLADLLNYAAVVEDGIVVGKDGSLQASWLYRGEDQASSADQQLDQATVLINKALAPLGTGWILNVDAARRPAPSYPARHLSSFPDPVSAAIDEERRRQFTTPGALFEAYFVITLTWLPPMLAERKLVELMFDDEAAQPDHTSRTCNLIGQFKQQITAIENRLSSVVKLTRLHGQKVMNEDGSFRTLDDQLSFLQSCITGLHHPVALPDNPAYLDLLIGGQEMVPGVVPKLGRKFIQIVAIDGFPLESMSLMLQALAEQPTEYRWSTRFIFMDQHEALGHLEKFRKKWKQKTRSLFDQIFNTNVGGANLDAINMVADAEAAKAEVSSSLVADGYYTSVVVVMNEDRARAEASALELQKAIQQRGFSARVETINTLDAFIGSLPGHGVQNVRRPLVNTLNLAHFLPLSSIWTGNPWAPCPLYPKGSPALMQCVTHGRTPFRLNLHVRDLGHTLLAGPTRAGKSTQLGMMAAQSLRYDGMTVYLFEAGMSGYPLTKAVGGRHFHIAGDDRPQFAPLRHLDSAGDRAWAMDWVDKVLALNEFRTTAEQRTAIGKAIMSLSNSGGGTLSDFFNVIQDDDVREALMQYTVNGSMGHLLDAAEDSLAFSRFNTFELGELMELGDKYVVPVLLYLFRRVMRSLKGQPAIIFLDEAWLMLLHPVFEQWIRKWLKTLAKLNCSVVLSTQNLSDAAKSHIFDVIVESTATKILLPNPFARDEEAAAMYRRIGLNDRQIEIVATAIPKKQYYLLSEEGRRLYELALGPLALSFVGTTDKASLTAIQRLEARHGEDWVHEWLALRGLKLDDYLEPA